MKLFLVFFIILFALKSYALQIPENLSLNQQKIIMQSLGVKSQKKHLSDPAPLGGFKGWEVIMSVEALDLTDIKSIDPQKDSSDFFFLPRLQLSKGIYYDIDLSLFFSPIFTNKDVKDFGGQVRWMPLKNIKNNCNLSFSFQVNSINYKDILFSTNLGFDLMLSRIWEKNSLYIGYGFIRNTSRITGKSDGTSITSDGEEVAQTESNMHIFIGGTHWWTKNFYGSMNLNFYESDIISSLSLGLRY